MRAMAPIRMREVAAAMALSRTMFDGHAVAGSWLPGIA